VFNVKNDQEDVRSDLRPSIETRVSYEEEEDFTTEHLNDHRTEKQ
jgi:hypothetical protein